MLPRLVRKSQKGYIAVVLIVFALLIAVLIFPYKFPIANLTKSDGFQYCREFITDPNAPTIIIPTTKDGTELGTYKLIKQNVPIRPRGYQDQHHIVVAGTTVVEGKNYQILYPTPDNGRSYDFNTEDGKTDISFFEYGLVFLVHLTDTLAPEFVPGTSGTSSLEIIDIYQDVTKPPIPLAENILKCVDEGIESVVDPVVLVPAQEVSEKKDQLQLEWFLIRQSKLLPKAWWTPECKPAIYLYPTQKQLVNVKVFPEGELTYVDPPYDLEKGWTVWVQPSGKIQDSGFKIYDYLYYESKIYDSAIKKPEKGWVVEYNKLEDLYNEVLPKLGLSQTETNDFVEYWTKSLPQAPYYFVGIVDPANVEEIERLEITPKPDSINRVRIYFERLDSFKQVETPVLTSHSSLFTNSFRVVEWGGMVKNDPNHPFTCSQ